MVWRAPSDTAMVPVPGLDLEEVRRALTLLADPEAWIGLRALVPGGKGARNLIAPLDLDVLVKQVEVWQRQGMNVYLNLNPVAVGTARPANLGPLVGHIARRRWLFLDIDPVKEAGHEKDSATEGEKARALALALRVRAYLESRGWPAPILQDSGNGCYLLYRIDLPNTDLSRELLKSVLVSLSERFTGEDGLVDTTGFDAPRIAKLAGTLARKGPHTQERPHRPCRLLEVPESLEIVGEAELVELVGVQTGEQPQTQLEPQRNGWHAPRTGGLSVEARAIAYMASCPPAIDGQGGSPQTYAVARAIVYGFDLGPEVGFRLLADHYNPRCIPEWSEKELRHKVADADTKPFGKPRGWLLKESQPRWRASDFREQNEPAAEPRVDVHVEPWPAPPAKEAFHGLAGRIVERIDPETEADPVAVLSQFLAYFGNCVGRTGFGSVGRKRHYPNLFLCLVGRTSKGRKGTSLDWINDLFARADPLWSDNCIQTGLSSGEGLINAVRDQRRKPPNKDEEEGETQDERAADKRLLVIEEEFSQVLRLANRDGNILSSVLRQAWDGGRLRTLTKTSPLKATDAHISVDGHVTREELVKCLTSTEQGNGFANRFLWLAVRRSKLLPDGGDDINLDDLAGQLGDVLVVARQLGRVQRSREARDLWHANYKQISAERPGAFGLCTNRAEAQVLRLSVVYALLDGSSEIRAAHLQAALALWDYSERSCRWIFGENTGNADADEILDALRAAAEQGMSGRDIHALFSRNRTAGQIRRALAALLEAGLVVARKESTDGKTGRPAERWYYCGQELRTKRTNEQTDGATTYGE